ncbi:MAG: protein-export chaperone SecB [Pseudomonadota bacterium]
MAEQNDTPAAGEKKPQIAVQRIYVKDISFEAPGTPHSFGVEWKPETKVQFNSGAQKIGDSLYEVVLTINVEASNGEKVAYIAEVQQAGVFFVDGPEAAMEPLLAAQCPGILFPYARETISDLVSRGTFPQMLLQPMNFDSIYIESKRRQQKKAAAEAAKH